MKELFPARIVRFLLLAALSSLGAELDKEAPPGGEPQGLAQGLEMDYGPFLAYTINCAEGSPPARSNLVIKGLAIQLGADPSEAAVCFDTELLRYAAGWTGGFLDISKSHLASYKGSLETFVRGQIRYSGPPVAGWTIEEQFRDPRKIASGPLPRDWGRYRGLFRHGRQVVLHYSVFGAEIHETPAFERHGPVAVFRRTIQIGPTRQPLKTVVCRARGEPLPGARGAAAGSGRYHVWQTGNGAAAAGVVHAPAGAGLAVAGENIELRLPALPAGALFQLIIASAEEEADVQGVVGQLVSSARRLNSPRDLCAGGPPLWTPPVATRGRLGFGAGPYVVDTLTVPEANPWKSWLRFIALDFFSDGRAAVSTWNGDVWVVSGLDDRLANLSWKRFAAGLYEPLGLKIVGDVVYARCRDQITRLRDLNGDGEADQYENFNNDGFVAPNYHAFAFDLETDRAGNFYYSRTGHRADPHLPMNGCILRVSPDGERTIEVAHGFRVPNGMSLGPNDEITCSDNQGNWIPSSRINLVKPGGFYGFVPQARTAAPPADYEKPICWVPMKLDNSSGGQVWVTSDRWGPFQGHLLHMSYGRCALFHVMTQEVHGQLQGGVMQFPLRFESGILRAQFHPRDGQLYVCGLRGWQTSAARDAALQRVRFTGKPVELPLELRVRRGGVALTFTSELDPASAADAQNYAVEQWNYRWSDKYGSPDYSVKDPDHEGRDEVEVKRVTLESDQRTVLLEIPGLQPVMQMRIQFRIRSRSGSVLAHEIYNTINVLP